MDLGSHSLSHSSPSPDKPCFFFGRKAPRKKEESGFKSMMFGLICVVDGCGFVTISSEFIAQSGAVKSQTFNSSE